MPAYSSESYISMAAGAVLAAVVIWAAARTPLLRDSSDAGRRPYSFSRVQLLWWTLIIAGCFLAAYGADAALPQVNETCLILLGIGMGASAIAKVIDLRQDAANDHRHQDDESQGFLRDILSDDSGVSVHRLQALIFNVIFGVVFVTEFAARGHTFPQFDATQFGLLGISASGYLYLKTQENQVPAAGAPAPALAVSLGSENQLILG